MRSIKKFINYILDTMEHRKYRKVKMKWNC